MSSLSNFLQQATGYVIVAEMPNFGGFLAHFRGIHPGSFFAELKTATLPVALGFLCPVHTLDGSPCGLLNYLSHTCRVINQTAYVSCLSAILAPLGVSQTLVPARGQKKVAVQLDDGIVGYCSADATKRVANALRHYNVLGAHVGAVPLDIELGYVSISHGRQYPGLYIVSTPALMKRPVKHLANGKIKMVCPGLNTHQELAPASMLSIIANLMPFSDFKKSRLPY
ncbi:putative RPA135-DNA-directed RNA polymerase I, 135 kd subunit [Dissophora ornata]|nr:putative RPA135-DNA-directed RNA polymerase I, 135 kd subunit [Dissophora ornata]